MCSANADVRPSGRVSGVEPDGAAVQRPASPVRRFYQVRQTAADCARANAQTTWSLMVPVSASLAGEATVHPPVTQ